MASANYVTEIEYIVIFLVAEHLISLSSLKNISGKREKSAEIISSHHDCDDERKSRDEKKGDWSVLTLSHSHSVFRASSNFFSFAVSFFSSFAFAFFDSIDGILLRIYWIKRNFLSPFIANGFFSYFFHRWTKSLK